MLNDFREDKRSNETVARYLIDNRNENSVLLGCPACPLYATCGGLAIRENIMDCAELCCGKPETCSTVCPNDPSRFISYRRETLGFDLANVQRAPLVGINLPDGPIPLIYHGSSRSKPLDQTLVALRLADIVDFRTGSLRYSSREELARAFCLKPGTALILSGVDHDHRIEPWWRLAERRLAIISRLSDLGVLAVTTPNFSLLLDRPRPDDLHSMKRIAITFSEFQNGGVAAALHVNGRTDRDFERWGEFIADREEVSLIAYEFITGPSQKDRIKYHLGKLAQIAEAASRELDIVVRGDPGVISYLKKHFRNVVYIDTTAFIKTQKRHVAIRVANNALSWKSNPTQIGETLDQMLASNVDEQHSYLRATYYGSDSYSGLV